MSRWIFIVLFFLFQSIPDEDQNDAVYAKYRQALTYYESIEPTDFTDSMALAIFKEIIDSKNKQN